MKIKTFRFILINIKSTDDIDSVVNEFTQDRAVIDIQTYIKPERYYEHGSIVSQVMYVIVKYKDI